MGLFGKGGQRDPKEMVSKTGCDELSVTHTLSGQRVDWQDPKGGVSVGQADPGNPT